MSRSSVIVARTATRHLAVSEGGDVNGRGGDVYEISARVRQRIKKKETGKK